MPLSVNLYDVPFDMALRAILKSNGFTAQQHNNVIVVTKAVEQPDSVARSMPTSMRTFHLNYANIPEAPEMVQKLLEATLDNDTALGINWDVLFGHNVPVADGGG